MVQYGARPGVQGRVCAIALLALLHLACAEQKSPTAPADLQSSLSAAFDAFTIPAGAACSISVSQHGQVVLERGRGQIAPGLAASADSLYRVASLTKPITASAVLVSEKAGRLQRTDKVNQYLAFQEPAPTIDELINTFPACRTTWPLRRIRAAAPHRRPWRTSCR